MATMPLKTFLLGSAVVSVAATAIATQWVVDWILINIFAGTFAASMILLIKGWEEMQKKKTSSVP